MAQLFTKNGKYLIIKNIFGGKFVFRKSLEFVK
jgi:hypothetical protein